MKAIVLVFLFAAMIVAAAETNCTPMQALEKFKKFTLCDGASCYTFSDDGTFKSGPVGMSGRTLYGTWKTTDGTRFVITAEAGWINGLSQPGDYRRIVFHISHLRKQKPKPQPPGWFSVRPEDLFEGYWFIEKVVRTEKPKRDATKAK